MVTKQRRRRGKILSVSVGTLWDSLSDILEEPGLKIPATLRRKAIRAIFKLKREFPEEA